MAEIIKGEIECMRGVHTSWVYQDVKRVEAFIIYKGLDNEVLLIQNAVHQTS